MNYAIDFARSGALGSHVLAAKGGTVVFAGADDGWGNTIVIDNGDGSFERYAHMQDGSLQVGVGAYVCTGRYIGNVGSTGNSTGPHLHFQVQHSATGPSVSYAGFIETNGAIPNCGGSYVSSQREATTSAECFVAAYQGQTQSPAPTTWVRPSSQVSFSVTYKNIGGATWENTGGVSNPQYIELRSVNGGCAQVNGALYDGTWINPQRIHAAQQNSVATNSSATFAFTGAAPSASGYYPQIQWVGPYAASACVSGWAGVNFEVRVDGTPPTAAQTGGPPASNYRTDQTISFAISDAHSGVRGYCASWDNPTPPSDACAFASSGSTTLSAAGALYTQHTLFIHAYDNTNVPNVSTTVLGTWILSPNRPPAISCPGTQSVAEGTQLSFGVSAIDPDGDPVTITATSLPPGATFDGGTFRWTPGYDQAGVQSANFSASDGSLSSGCGVTINVGNVDRPPVVGCPSTQAGAEGSLLSFPVAGSDPDGDPVVVTASNLPVGATFDGTTFTWTPTHSQAGSYTATFIAANPPSLALVRVSRPRTARPTRIGSTTLASDPCNVSIQIQDVCVPPAVADVSPSSGVPGDAVAVAGSYFGAGFSSPPDSMYFSGENGTLVPAMDLQSSSWSDTVITTHVPSGAVSGPIYVLNPCGRDTLSSGWTNDLTGVGSTGPRIGFGLGPIQPNPSRGSATISVQIPSEMEVTLRIYAPAGQQVETLRQGVLPPGRYSVTWAGTDRSGRAAPAGLYFVQLTAAGRTLSRRLVLVR